MNESSNVDVGDVTATAWSLYRRDHVRDPRKVGSSQIARCIGELGYLISGTEFTNPDAAEKASSRVGKDALIGIAVHKAVLPYVVQSWLAHGAAAAEDEITLTATFEGVELTGHSDIAAEVAADVVDILELKTVSENMWAERGNARAPKTDHVMQGADYCARYEAQHPDKTVRNLTIWYVNRNRNTTDLHYTMPYRNSPVRGTNGYDLHDWITQRHRLLSDAVADPDRVKKEYKNCGDCGFQERCLGKTLRSENGDDVVHDEAVADIVRAAKQARQARKEHDKEYKKLKELLDDLGPDDGVYVDDTGGNHKLRWRDGGETIDYDLVRQWFNDHGDDPIVSEFMQRHGGRLPTKFRTGSWSM